MNGNNISFEDLHELPEEGQTKPTVEGPSVSFDEDCPKCGGTGSYGRVTRLGHSRCNKCKGTGKLTFKTSPEYRAKARAGAVKRKAAKAEKDRLAAAKRWDEWLADHEAVAEWLPLAIARGDNFATSLTNDGLKWGRLTENQENAVYKSIARDEDREERERTPAAKVEMAGLLKAFGNAFESGLKRPKLTIGLLQFSKAPDHGKNPGCLYAKHNGQYIGKITAEGNFHKSFACADSDLADIKALGNDVLAKAVEHGRRTGNCACCGRQLTDPKSVERGIGPICKDNWGI